ncbi:MAG: NAD-dependent epimerase/dehydratase family protein [Candidatus Burarchaeum sp.]|nr:NAD-dependent epimerase/dehydratase family protein [Candidatus Burarchaeum sp.]MDO8339603.1 NAD-dependent epimerase/dehydratase family protein [Candidatus Burarchaeum sp.]
MKMKKTQKKGRKKTKMVSIIAITSKKRALVTGASGRVGGLLVEKLLQKGYVVRALVRDSAGAEKLPSGVEVAFGNITDPDSLKGCCEKVDVVFHLAASINYKAGRDVLQAVNGRGTANMVTEAAHANVKRFVYASSIAVYGKVERGRPLKESDELAPTDDYGASKRAGENAVRHGAVPFVILRLGMVYGPGFDEAYLPLLKMLEKRRLSYVGSADNNIPFVYVGDVVNAFLLAGEKYVAMGETYNIVGERITQRQALDLACDYLGVPQPKLHASPRFLTLSLNMLNAIEKMAGKKSKLIPEYIEVLYVDRSFDTDKARMELGWEPRKPIDRGIREMVEYYKEKKKR